MLEQGPLQVQDHTRMAAVALGVCIARTLARQNPSVLRSFAEEADRMEKHLHDQGRPEWAEFLTPFALAVGDLKNSHYFIRSPSFRLGLRPRRTT